MFRRRDRTRACLADLRDLPPFAGCSANELARIDSLLSRVELAAARCFIHEGTLGRECFVVEQGEVGLARGGRVVGVATRGHWVGLEAVSNRRRHMTTATTLGTTTLLVVDPRGLATLLTQIRCLSEPVRDGDAETEIAEDRAFEARSGGVRGQPAVI